MARECLWLVRSVDCEGRPAVAGGDSLADLGVRESGNGRDDELIRASEIRNSSFAGRLSSASALGAEVGGCDLVVESPEEEFGLESEVAEEPLGLLAILLTLAGSLGFFVRVD